MGYCFYCYLWSLHNSLVTDCGCSGNNGSVEVSGVLFLLLFVVAAQLVSHGLWLFR